MSLMNEEATRCRSGSYRANNNQGKSPWMKKRSLHFLVGAIQNIRKFAWCITQNILYAISSERKWKVRWWWVERKHDNTNLSVVAVFFIAYAVCMKLELYTRSPCRRYFLAGGVKGNYLWIKKRTETQKAICHSLSCSPSPPQHSALFILTL